MVTISGEGDPGRADRDAASETSIIVSDKVKASGVKTPGRHLEGTGPTIGQKLGLSSWKHRRGEASTPAVWIVPISDDDVSTIVQDHYYETLSAWVEAATARNARALERAERNPSASAEGYRSSCWQLAGELRGHPIFAEAAGPDVADVLEGLIDWDQLPEFDSYGESTSPRDALIDAIDFQYEHDIPPLLLALPPVNALEFAHRYPLSRRYERAHYAFTVSLLFWYQRLLGQDGKFFLSVETLAQLAKCSSKTSSLCLHRAVREKLIEILREHERHTRRSREYRWIGDPQFVRHLPIRLSDAREPKQERSTGGPETSLPGSDHPTTEQKIIKVLAQLPNSSDDSIARLVNEATTDQVRELRASAAEPPRPKTGREGEDGVDGGWHPSGF